MIGKVALTPEESICEGCANIARYQRAIADRDEQHRKANPDAKPSDPLPSDGLHVHLRVMTAQEEAAVKARVEGSR